MSGYLLDTSVLVTLGRPADGRHGSVRRWYDATPADELWTCTIVLGELARVVAVMSAGARRQQQEEWLHDVVVLAFADRVLGFDLDCAVKWGALMGEGQLVGRLPPAVDTMIAAIAAVNALTVVTTKHSRFRDDWRAVPRSDRCRAEEALAFARRSAV